MLQDLEPLPHAMSFSRARTLPAWQVKIASQAPSPLKDLAIMQVAAISAAVSPVSAPQQMTIAGRPCQFPFFYRGIPRTACVPYSDEDSAAFCLDVDGRYAMCSPQPLSAYSTPQSWLDQWAGKGALQTSVGLPPHNEPLRASLNLPGCEWVLCKVLSAAPVCQLHSAVLAGSAGQQGALQTSVGLSCRR